MRNKPNLRNAEMNVKSFFIKDYGDLATFGAEENKANQSQFEGPPEVMRARFVWAKGQVWPCRAAPMLRPVAQEIWAPGDFRINIFALRAAQDYEQNARRDAMLMR